MHVTLKEPHRKLGLDLATSAANLLGKWGKWGKSHLRTTAPPLASGTRLFGKWELCVGLACLRSFSGATCKLRKISTTVIPMRRAGRMGYFLTYLPFGASNGIFMTTSPMRRAGRMGYLLTYLPIDVGVEWDLHDNFSHAMCRSNGVFAHISPIRRGRRMGSS